MKKTSVVLFSALLTGSLCMFTACGDGGSVGKVDGNFKQEATAQELQTALSSINLENAFGTGDKVGFQIQAEMAVSAKGNGVSSQMEMSFDYAMQGPKMPAAPQAAQDGAQDVVGSWKDYIPLDQFIGAGKIDFSLKQSAAGSSNAIAFKSQIYQDPVSIYLDFDMNGQKMKGKISIEELLEALEESMDPELPEIEDDTDIELPDISDGTDVTDPSDTDVEIDWNAVVSSFKPYIDDSKGLKIKFEGREQFLVESLVKSGIPVDGANFSALVCDVYLSFGEDGRFLQMGLDIDFAMSVGQIKVSVKGGFALKSFNGTITLPEGIASDSSYQQIPIKDMIGDNAPII